MVVRYRF